MDSAPAPTEALLPTVDAAEPPPLKVLTICIGPEPASLFLYADASGTAGSIRQAIYDGPVDLNSYEFKPVILESIPSLGNGGAALEAVAVKPGETIYDGSGNLTTLAVGVIYWPAGCSSPDCAVQYAGGDPAQMDQLAVRYQLKAGLKWSDGGLLTSMDSEYAYQLARALFPRYKPDLLKRTASYTALDGQTLEWRGWPGERDPLYATNFFTPLPWHAWQNLPPDQLLAADTANRSPLGWGPYIITEWTAGDHITLRKNLNYFRAAEGLPVFDRLVFRFTASSLEALTALQAGECDLVDEPALQDVQVDGLRQLQDQGRLKVAYAPGTAWEHADFGLLPADPTRPALFASKAVRQAVAQCIDRERMASELFFAPSQVLDTYVPPGHPLADKQARHYAFDPQAAAAALQTAGWLDADQNPATPRTALGLPGVPDGTPFEFTYLMSASSSDSNDSVASNSAASSQGEQAADILKTSLAQCGIKVDVQFSDGNSLFAPGPRGPVFGRQFDMAQFAWSTSLFPPCYLYESGEIPGPSPDFPKGWGGANASGYRNPEFDQACWTARQSLPDLPEYAQAGQQAQEIFAEDLPALPLYLRLRLVAFRPDLCNVAIDPTAESALWNIEMLAEGPCSP